LFLVHTKIKTEIVALNTPRKDNLNMDIFTGFGLTYDSINNTKLFPVDEVSTPDEDLNEKLFRRYARGGIRYANIRASMYFFMLKFNWVFLLKSQKVLKRTTDIFLSSFFLIIFSPLLILTAIAIKIEDRSIIIYRQTRIGKWGRPFKIYKFRSMKKDSDQIKKTLVHLNEMDGIIFKIKNDPRLTRTGRFIRKYSIDELPQLINVLKGDMSLVGPRPPLPDEVNNYGISDRKRLEVKPGLTCIWQVSGRSEIHFNEQVKLDVDYIEKQSFLEDIKLLLKTIPAVLSCRGAY
jgi:lipopolysaccharide/colanic/teichoic acid biosynthesis glycosyltransferase